jgi:two-component system, LytTR family, response regulator
MLKILIVDDEAAAGNILKILINKYIATDIEIEYVDSVKSALELVSIFKPSLVMLDIEMPEMNGFDFLSLTKDNAFDVIFTTAYDKYAIKAIRFSALDYLLKPIDVLDLQNAINRHIVKNQSQNQQPLVNNLLSNLQQPDPKNFKLALSTSEGTFFYEPNEIIYCEGENNYTRFNFVKQKPLLVSKTLGDYEDLLADHQFLRIHKSHLINIKYVTKVNRDGTLTMTDGKELSISKRKKEMVMSVLKS